MSGMDTKNEFDSEMTEKMWIKNKRSIIKGLQKNREMLKSYRVKLLSDKISLMEEVESLEKENYEIMGRVKELEMQHLGKANEEKVISLKLSDARNKLVRPLAEENSYLSEIDFLESEKAGLFELRDRTAESLNNNMTDLSDIIMDIEFIKGEIQTLVSKINMVEDDIPGIYGEMDDLDERISSTSKALTDLYNRMKIVEKNAKTFYYNKK